MPRILPVASTDPACSRDEVGVAAGRDNATRQHTETRKETPSSAKALAGPPNATTQSAPSGGPAIRLSRILSRYSEFADCSNSPLTSCGIIDWYAGWKKLS